MPTIYKVHDPRTKETLYMSSKVDARKARARNHEVLIEPLDYNYQWQLVIMLNEAYLQGREDVFSRMD